MPVQSTYPNTRDAAVAGMSAHSEGAVDNSVIVESAIAAGLCVIQGTTTKTEGAPPSALTAVPTALVASGAASAITAQTISGSSLNGAVGQGQISPPKNVTLTFSSHADWDATTAVVTGLNEFGAVVTESFAIPNNGNATVVGSVIFENVISILIPAQSGTGGTLTAGTGVKLGIVDSIVHGVSLYDASREPGVWPVDRAMPVRRRGPVWVYAEGAVNPSLPVFVRFLATGNETLGRFRGSPDANDCGRLQAARWLDTTSGEGFARLDLNLP